MRDAASEVTGQAVRHTRREGRRGDGREENVRVCHRCRDSGEAFLPTAGANVARFYQLTRSYARGRICEAPAWASRSRVGQQRRTWVAGPATYSEHGSHVRVALRMKVRAERKRDWIRCVQWACVLRLWVAPLLARLPARRCRSHPEEKISARTPLPTFHSGHGC